MKPFVFIFRQGNRVLSGEEEARRATEVRTWALRQISEGRNLDPRLMASEYCLVSPEPENVHPLPGTASPAAAIVFFEASSFDEAVGIAKTHPGLRYGVSIEVRPWTTPLPTAKAA
jgi:hypothetical protein